MSTEPAAGPPKDLPKIFGGYRVVRELGRGRVGPLVLAVHRATGRRLALRVLKPEWACLPKYVSRLTRDAFAAAQVSHPNVVRLDGFENTRGRLGIASEYVDGPSLASIVRAQGALAAPLAVAHVLHAARGLRFAHGQGLAHGDVRPESLLIDPEGLTRLADLGLTKTPASVEADEAREARAPIAVGAEAQAEADAAPFRADVRGLGQTLAFALTGKAEVHPTALVSAGLPMNLVELIRNMVEPRPGVGGAGDLAHVVPALERFLNGRGPAATTLREEDTTGVAGYARSFHDSPTAALRRQLVAGSVVTCAVVMLMGLLAGRPLFAASILGLGLMTALARFVIAGVTRDGPPFAKVRGYVLEGRWSDWLIGAAGLAVFAAGLVALNLIGAWIAFGLLALILAALLHLVVDPRVDAERRGAVEAGRALLKRLRLRGVSEETLRRFFRTTDGDDRGEFFEALFGFEAALDAREAADRGWKGLVRRRSIPWREAVDDWVEARRAARRRERDWVLLQGVEERGLVAEGVNLLTARRRSRRIAEAMVTAAAAVRASHRDPAAAGGGVSDGPTVAAALRRAAEVPENVLVEHETTDDGRDFSRLPDLLLGPRTRFLLGAAVLAGFLLWVYQNRIVSPEQIQDVAARALNDPETLRDARVEVRTDAPTRPLRLAALPRPVTSLFRGYNAGAAGLVLIVSALFGGWRAGLWAVGGAALALIGPSFGLPPNLAAGLAAGLPAVVILFGWARDD